MKKILFIAAATLLGLTACTEDYKDWEPQQQPTQPATVTFGDGSVTEASVIDLNNIADGQTLVKVAVIVPPTASVENYEPNYILAIGEQDFALDADGQMSVAELQALIAEQYGLRPVARELTATISMWMGNGSTAVKTATSAPFIVRAIPQAPIIETAYYLTGSINGWDNTNTDYKLTNDGSDPYDDPTFKLRIPAPEDGGNIEFKMTPESGLGGDWSGCLAAGSEAGKFNYGNDGGNLVIEADPDALYYDLTFNMLDKTWKAVPVGFNPFIYEIGNESGWAENHPLYGNGTGQYEAVIYLDGEFKFKPNKDNWEGDWEKASGNAQAGTLTADGGPNIDAVAAGFYFVQVDLKEMTYRLTPVNSISIIGNGGDWATDIELTYNEALGCWQTSTTLQAGEFKFRANHDWAVNWGGSFDNLTQGGGNLSVAETGAYIVRLFLSDEAPAHCTVTPDLGFPDFLYEIGAESGWSTSHALTGNGQGQYVGYVYLNGEFKFKPNKDNWDGDFEKAGGDAYQGTLQTDGGPNVDAPAAGFYKIDVDLALMTYKLTAITVGLVGPATVGGWDAAQYTVMTYNTESGAWEWTGQLAADEFKFTCNGAWDINWGGALDNLEMNGANLRIDEAGNYAVSLTIETTGKAHASVVKN